MVARRPREGDTVESRGFTGVVYWVGSAQFAFRDEDAEVTHQNGRITKGFTVSCLFKEEYKIVKRKPISKRDIKAKIAAKKQRVSGGVHGRKKRSRRKTRNGDG